MIYQIVESLIKKSPNKNKQLRFVISSQGLQDFIYAKCPSFKQIANFETIWWLLLLQTKLKKILLKNHFCAKKQILSHYSESAWLLSILGKTHHISPTLNTRCVESNCPLRKNTTNWIYVRTAQWVETIAKLWANMEIPHLWRWKLLNFLPTPRKIHTPTRTNSWFHLKKMDPSSKEMFFRTWRIKTWISCETS